MELENKSKMDLGHTTKKIFVILGLTFALLIPLYLVENQISERGSHETVARKEVAKGWGNDVTLGSPIAYYNSTEDVYPSHVGTTISVDSKEKKRGAFQIPVYVVSLKSRVIFSAPKKPQDSVGKTDPSAGLSSIFIPAKPAASIQNFKIIETTTGKELQGKLVDGGIQIAKTELPNKDLFSNQLEIEISARGTGYIYYDSKVDRETVTMTGNWPKPKFIDTIFPDNTEITSEGFTASWTLNALGWNTDVRETRSIGLNQLWINPDQVMTERATKYGILFIALTFLLVFVIEFMSGVKIHPLQYGLIGLAISIFYLLLLALSEVIGFNGAYLTSSVAVISLIVFYVHGFLNQKKFVVMILGEQLVLSGFFYVLLCLEDLAFLIGTLGLFIALATCMIVTRKLNWYTGSFKKEELQID